MITKEKTQENDFFLTEQAPILSPDFIRWSMVTVIPNNISRENLHC